ncbi:uncharacterized protein PV07_09441 [Cladophialophora immunda]|uniref:BTB domain-containing protein n=1 Tax=Cladophialophora immunda TaxID=569365 RepID=A0A0D1ZEX9_9EURO|nr:uncharacterized protein PV07_09441 [Cladophialophora immunda]KIW26341.1 hypothetical protein PV07_09441 [Cladophialophora immunda]OQV06019.1 hypothetical protein CLAIMM_10662 [Cladophialophora immunda]
MAVTDSDLRTFASSLKKERQPDFDIIVKDYRWAVHGHVISGHGDFGELCSDAPEEQNGKRRKVHLEDDEPVTIAHLILWWYTEEYDDENMSDIAGFDIHSLLKHGKVSPSNHSDREVSEPEAGPDSAEEDVDCMDLSPISLHAKMYLIAHKYGITELREKAVCEITEILTSVKEALLPCLAHFFVTNSPVASSMDGNKGSVPTDQDIGATNTNPPPARFAISEQRDPELWKTLAETTSRHFLSHHTDPTFQQIITCNPRFHWAVMGRVASMLEAAQDKLANTPAEPPKVPKKRGRKKQETAPGAEGAEDKKKGKEAGAPTPKKVKKEP